MSHPSTAGLPDDLPAEWRRAFNWIEAELGGTIVRAERQGRWRPAWFLDLKQGDELVPLYFRGERGEADHGVYDLEHELKVLQVLEQHDVLVPHVYGFCREPRGIVMQRSPGRANLATARDQSERESVMDHYVEILAKIHSIDIAAFEAIGVAPPSGSQQAALMDFEVWERGYRGNKQRPEPAIEFAIQWIRRNVPQGDRELCFVCADAGQFMFDEGRVTGVIDLELATIGEAAADWGGMRGRDLSEPLGDLSRALVRYEDITGKPLDRRSIDHHTVRFGMVTPMATAHLVASAPPGLDLIQYLSWYLVWTRTPLEVIAEGMQLELSSPQLPDPIAPYKAPSGLEAGDFAAYQADRDACLSIYEKRRAELGSALAAEDLADAARLLGRQFADSQSADRALEEFILAAPPEADAQLVDLLHRRLLRQEAILQPVLRELAGAQIQSLQR